MNLPYINLLLLMDNLVTNSSVADIGSAAGLRTIQILGDDCVLSS